ncbi:MAG: phosphatase PAP2 family protein [Candidatus Saccharibacteria bacterium]|nr:phosphatase PAP2 family protein [Candidatus Saccharibacteria bacterium]
MTEPSNSKKILSLKGRAVLATTCLVLGIIVFIVAYIGMKQSVGVGSLNLPILTWMINHRADGITVSAKIITSIANPYFFASITAVVVFAWMGLRREIWRPVILACAVAVAAATSTLLKLHFMDSRPPQIDMIPTYEYDFSFPSGHTIGIAVFLLVVGYLIYSRNYSLQRFWAWIATAVIGTSLVALSRLYLGYHWLTDIIASVGLALIILAIIIAVDSVYLKRYKI